VVEFPWLLVGVQITPSSSQNPVISRIWFTPHVFSLSRPELQSTKGQIWASLQRLSASDLSSVGGFQAAQKINNNILDDEWRIWYDMQGIMLGIEIEVSSLPSSSRRRPLNLVLPMGTL
jgi:hypothetical protein